MNASGHPKPAAVTVRVLGVDPGSRSTGYAIVDATPDKTCFVAAGCVRAGDGAMPERLATIFAGLVAVIAQHGPEVMAIEQVFVARSAESALKLGQARGAAIVAAVNARLPVVEYAARRVKVAVTGSGAATKDQVARMVAVLLGLGTIPTADAADALAIALCHVNSRDSPLRWPGAGRGRRRWTHL